jgi:hypothetical protein
MIIEVVTYVHGCTQKISIVYDLGEDNRNVVRTSQLAEKMVELQTNPCICGQLRENHPMDSCGTYTAKYDHYEFYEIESLSWNQVMDTLKNVQGLFPRKN